VLTKLSRIVLIAAVAALGITGVAEAKAHKIHMVGHGGQTGVKLHSTYKGTPFGTCKMTGTLVIPNTKQTWKCGKRGSFKLIGHGTTGAADNSKGTWRIVRGSGKGRYKGITGKGTFKGRLSTGVFTYTGTVHY
jgi:uncharacterized protein DUF3224